MRKLSYQDRTTNLNMNWFQLIVTFVFINRMDKIQIKADTYVNDKMTETFLDVFSTNLSSCENQSNMKATACKKDYKLILNIRTEFISENVYLESRGHNCYQFLQEHKSFVANLNKLDNFSICEYVFMENDKPLYFLDENIYNVYSECPEENEVCLVSACPLKKFNVVAEKADTFINLHLTWEKININATIDIESNDYDNCMTDNKFNYPLINNNLIIPNMVTKERIELGCSYNISISSAISKDKINCVYTYTVPDCVANSCDCRKYGSKAKILEINHLLGNKFLVVWDPGENSTHYTIKTVKFSYTNSTVLLSISKQAPTLRNNFNEHTSEIEMTLYEGSNYNVSGYFENNVSCSNYDYFQFLAPIKQQNYSFPIIITVIFIILLVLLLFVYKRIPKYFKIFLNFLSSCRQRYRQPELFILPHDQIPMNRNIQYIPIEFLEGRFDKYEFPKNKIIIKEVIGSGAFGQVYSAKAEGIGGIKGWKMVAVKTLGERENITSEVTKDFITEIEIFKKIGQHPNIVKLLGCCTTDPPYMMIMELVPCGDLKNYLLDLRKQWLKMKMEKKKQVFFSESSNGIYIENSTPTSPLLETSSDLPSSCETMYTSEENPLTPLMVDYNNALDRVLDHTELQHFALQIARGMAHLEKISVTHRDLAARNILINEYKTLKISDFGLSRCGPYINHKTKKFPLRWMAIEAIVEQKYDSRSDVWSFGIVLWEIGTLGAFPYESLPDSYILQFLQIGKRLERPAICTDELYLLMNQCWATDPDERPTFYELVDALDVNKRKIYVNFNQLNPTYVFPPSDMNKCPVSPVQIVDLDIT